ncbi:hypothetical protein DV702_01765 [Sporosarcina sp. PTS2304]|uniref:ATP-binding protein n=1 Tax=Sporosarcina sp. PTS2304 TaxID=2283194 RepID=UPI000E0DAD7C|nr:ATP-binding protein [Sporosarcina sp. PTS2304]AXH98546.1 hypothetical protein DV702_01765 [Sporosarcina sp. PTS2304]
MVMRISDKNKYLESALYKLIIDENGRILGGTSAFKKLVKAKNLPSHISEVFDDVLFGKLHVILESNKHSKTIIQNQLAGNLRISNKQNTSCYIIYQPDRKMAIITINIDLLSQTYENSFMTCPTPSAIINEWGFFVSVNDAFHKNFHFPTTTNNVKFESFLKDFQFEEDFCFKNLFLHARNQTTVHARASFERYGEMNYYNIFLKFDIKTEMYHLRVENITEQEQLLKLLAHNEQLSMTGEIAASIAHEVRNPMTTLQGFLQLLEHEVSGNAHKYVTVIQDEVKRMNDILNEMLLISKPIVDEKTIFSLTVLIEEVLTLLRPKALLDQINIVNEIRIVEPVLIKANPNRIKQVLVNLFKNAMEAMEPNGTLNVIVSDETSQMVEIIISDTGTGISEELLDNIFDPFVSSKQGGTGLGLPFVGKTVKESGGTIAVKSEVGKGTEFQLKFPLLEASLVDDKSEVYIQKS